MDCCVIIQQTLQRLNKVKLNRIVFSIYKIHLATNEWVLQWKVYINDWKCWNGANNDTLLIEIIHYVFPPFRCVLWFLFFFSSSLSFQGTDFFCFSNDIKSIFSLCYCPLKVATHHIAHKINNIVKSYVIIHKNINVIIYGLTNMQAL